MWMAVHVSNDLAMRATDDFLLDDDIAGSVGLPDCEPDDRAVS